MSGDYWWEQRVADAEYATRRPSHYDMPRDTNPPHWTAFRGCHYDCPGCAAEQEIAERNQR